MTDEPPCPDPVLHRQWRLYLRKDEAKWACVVVSPYGVPTAAAQADERDEALCKGREIADHFIESHYPDRQSGRYGPPTQFRPKPGQPSGWSLVTGRQVLSGEIARCVCTGVGWEAPT